jgi:hypothetical protein
MGNVTNTFTEYIMFEGQVVVDNYVDRMLIANREVESLVPFCSCFTWFPLTLLPSHTSSYGARGGVVVNPVAPEFFFLTFSTPCM